jgi:hypothetical protein
LVEAGFTAMRWHQLDPDPNARGPLLFAASASKEQAT